MKTALAIAMVVMIAACGDNNKAAQPDATVMIDAPIEVASFTSFVIDLVLNQTADTTDPHPYSDFATLPDPDGSNSAAYSSLFP